MIARRVTRLNMEKALLKVNRLYKGNVIFRNIDRMTDPQNALGSFRFTLKVREGHGPGGGISSGPGYFGRGRYIANACWHVHGHFFDALFSIAPDAKIRSKGRTIDVRSGNWQDYNVGSMMNPRMASEACDCNNNGYN